MSVVDCQAGQFALVRGWRCVDVEKILKVTPKMVKTQRDRWGPRQRRKHELVAVFADEAEAQKLAVAINAHAKARDDVVRAARDECAKITRAADEVYDQQEAALLASADTHPKNGDVKQAPLVSGAVAESETPNNPKDQHSGGVQ